LNVKPRSVKGSIVLISNRVAPGLIPSLIPFLPNTEALASGGAGRIVISILKYDQVMIFSLAKHNGYIAASCTMEEILKIKKAGAFLFLPWLLGHS